MKLKIKPFRLSKINIGQLIGVFIGLALLIAGNVRWLGIMAFLLAIGCVALANRSTFSLDTLNKSVLVIVIYCVVNAVASLLLSKNDAGNIVGDLLRYIILVLAFFLTYNADLKEHEIRSIQRVAFIISIIIVVVSFVQVRFKFEVLETNTILSTRVGADIFLVVCLFFFLANRELPKYIVSVIGMVVTYVAQSRTAMLVIAIFLFLYIFFKHIIWTKRNSAFIFWTANIIYLIIPVTYVFLSNSRYRVQLDLLAEHYTHHRFFSVRDLLWSGAAVQIQEHPLFGNGIGARLETAAFYADSSEVSTHNLYIYILMQLGVVGLIFFCILFYKIWKKFILDQRNTPVYMAFMIALLLQQVFSLGLVSGKMGFALLSWCILALGAQDYNRYDCS